MSAHSASSAAPANALRVWSDGRRIYVEISGSPGNDPYITAYDYNYRGIDLMLSLLGQHRTDYDYQGSVPASYRKRWSGVGSKQVGTESQSAIVEAGLRKAGIIK